MRIDLGGGRTGVKEVRAGEDLDGRMRREEVGRGRGGKAVEYFTKGPQREWE